MATMTVPEPASREATADLSALIGAELGECEQIFAAELRSRLPVVQSLVNHTANYRGKRLRPVLLLLSGQAAGRLTDDHPVLAAVVEMIHTATLVHDDILDEALVRRHVSTVNAEWGNETAVLLGDYLFTHAFHLAASLDSTLACRWIGRATNLVCEGEMAQVRHRGDLDLDEATYFEIIRGKTAELTAVSCRLGAHYAGAPESTVARMDVYGRELGVAFQIADDLLDLWGDERAAGKSLGTDLQKQKLTLPIIHYLTHAASSAAGRLRARLADPDAGLRGFLRAELERSGSLRYARERAEASASRAVDALAVLPESTAKTRLATLPGWALRRSG